VNNISRVHSVSFKGIMVNDISKVHSVSLNSITLKDISRFIDWVFKNVNVIAFITRH